MGTKPWIARALALVASGCVSDGRPPPPEGNPPAGSGGGQGFFDLPESGPPEPDAAWLCGSLVVPIAHERPNLYFVVDASGSMARPLHPPVSGASTLYQAARLSIAQLLRAVGHRVQYGAAIFPGQTATLDNPCPAGREVFSTRRGDDVSYALGGRDGPMLSGLLSALARETPSGTTPTAATLQVLAPKLRAIPGKTFVFLITDGAPNCDPTAECPAERCEANIVRACEPDFGNCCDPALFGRYANLGCLDVSRASRTLAELSSDAIHTYVIGLPGTETFAGVLDELAVAGGVAQEQSPHYFPVERAEELAQALKRLASTAVIECELELAEAPPDPRLVNVYFDRTLVSQSEEQGWLWLSDRKIGFAGSTCDLLKGGDVLQVQVAAGCPTVVH